MMLAKAAFIERFKQGDSVIEMTLDYLSITNILLTIFTEPLPCPTSVL